MSINKDNNINDVNENNSNLKVEFKYKFNDTFIKFILKEELKEVWIDDIYIDYDHPKIFFLLLRQAIDKFSESGYNTFVQSILKEEWDILKDFGWEIKKDIKDSPILIVQCKLEDSIFIIAKSLGLDN